MSSLVMAQAWAPPGAVWYYDWVSMWNSGYVKIQYTGDTMVNGRSCKILQKERHWFDWLDSTYHTDHFGFEYTYLENNVVYNYRNGQFYTLYDFNANAGDSWIVAGWNNSAPDSTGVVDVDSTGITNINSFSLKVVNLSPALNSCWALNGRAIERIGSMGYMFPEPNCVVDLYEGGPLRCYYDSTFGLYEPGSAPACDYIVGMDNLSMDNRDISIYPNPANSMITIEYNRPVQGWMSIEISDLFGKKMKNIETGKAKLTIDVKDLLNGVYFISIRDKSGMICRRKIIKYNP